MTLTALMPTLRRTLPDPIRTAAWPEHTHATTTDVVVAGVSLLRLVELCDTPCVHCADAATPGGQHRRPALQREAAVVAMRVTSVVQSADDTRVVLVDACVDAVHGVWAETRLIGRASTAKTAAAILLSGDARHCSGPDALVVHLPADLRAGDLLAVPCSGSPALGELRPQPSVAAAPFDAPLDAAAPAWWGRLQ